MAFINSLKLMTINRKLSLVDIESLNELLKTGLPLKNALTLIKTKDNEKAFTEIINKLDKGFLIEDAIVEHLPKSFISYLKPLIHNMSFSQSLNLAISFHNKSTDNLKNLEKSIMYPLILLFLGISGLYLFDNYGLDMLINMLKSFNTDLSMINILRVIFRIIIYLFYFGMLIAVSLILYFSREKNIAVFYIFISKYFHNSIVQVYFCAEFISLFLICNDLGYKTKDALRILKSLHNKPIISLLAFHLEESLLKGNSLKQASSQIYFDETLSKFVNVAIHTNDFVYILNNYLTLSNERIVKTAKRLTLFIQLGTYIFIGAIIIFIYQLLFLPMQAISNF